MKHTISRWERESKYAAHRFRLVPAQISSPFDLGCIRCSFGSWVFNAHLSPVCPPISRFQLVVSSVKSAMNYEYEIKLFDISNYGIMPGQSTNEVFVPPDPGALVAAAVAVSRDNQQLYVYYPESTVRTLKPFTRMFSPLSFVRR